MQSYETLVAVVRSNEYNQRQRHAAFAQLVAQFSTMALACAQQIVDDEQLAQDVTQEAFLTAYQQLTQLREPVAFPGWLRRIVHTHCHRVLRIKRPETLPMERLKTALTAEGDLAQSVADADTAQAVVDYVMAAIADLPEHERTVVRLFYFEGYSIRDVAATLDLPVTTIKKRLQYARDRLRNRLLDQYQKGNLSLQTWALQAGQWLLPLLAVLSPEPVLCAVPINAGRHYRVGSRR